MLAYHLLLLLLFRHMMLGARGSTQFVLNLCSWNQLLIWQHQVVGKLSDCTNCTYDDMQGLTGTMHLDNCSEIGVVRKATRRHAYRNDTCCTANRCMHNSQCKKTAWRVVTPLGILHLELTAQTTRLSNDQKYCRGWHGPSCALSLGDRMLPDAFVSAFCCHTRLIDQCSFQVLEQLLQVCDLQACCFSFWGPLLLATLLP